MDSIVPVNLLDVEEDPMAAAAESTARLSPGIEVMGIYFLAAEQRRELRRGERPATNGNGESPQSFK
ncbi:MAG: hypothetical protein EXS30_01640 [Pedosphaera sp.]|nr:hypothetical protein [Pedosphaera sp.]